MSAETSKRESRLRDGVENLHGDVVDAFYPKGNEGLADDLDAYLDASAEDRETLKTALAHRYAWPTKRAAAAAVTDYIDNFYNPYRRHSAVGFLSPVEFELDFKRPAMAA